MIRPHQESLFVAGTKPGSSATFSPCRQWRYTLERRWSNAPGRVVFIGLNPSTADESKDDPTIRRCIGYAKAWGLHAYTMLNLFAWRSTDPKALYSVDDPIGPDNDAAIFREVRGAAKVIAAWGKHGALRGRGDEVLMSLKAHGVTVHCLSRNNDNSPSHPLYLPAAAVPQVMT